MSDIISRINHFFEKVITADKLFSALWLVVGIAVILISFRVLRKIVLRVAERKCNPQAQHIIGKAIHYTGVVIVVMTVFNRFGINFSALLGAAGIAGIAVGFAAQTSVSNVISGVFMMTERAFKIGDMLQVDNILGTVESIDFLSIRLRTPENQLVRIPNETIIKTNLINVTHYPFRRFTMRLGVAYGVDLRRVREVLMDIAAANEFAITDPAPLVVFDSFQDSSIAVEFGVWADTSRYLDLKNTIMVEVAERFAAEGISLPFPQLDVRFTKA